MLIILAGITLNAVIGEGGIIFQARDTRNKISNETTYDNAQLAQLQNELKDNGLYSGIGIIPGTDNGGGSEGGENGTSGGNQGGSGTNQGGQGSNTGGDNTNTGEDNKNQNATVRPSQNQDPGGGTLVGGKTDEDPFIYVVSGEEIAASFYQSDVTIQIYTNDRSKKIKYILTTTVAEISNELYPSELVRELDIENGGTLTFTKDGEYTITAYAYDSAGNKSNPTIMCFKRQVGGSTTGGITLSIASGNEGVNKWYTSNVTIRILGTDKGSAEVRYRVKGTATSTGQIGDKDILVPGNFDSGEVKIANGTTFRIVADGTYSITAYSYDAGGMRLSSSEVLTLKKDATKPTIKSYTGEQLPGQGFKVKVNVIDNGAGLTSNAYVYRHKESTSLGEYISSEPTGNAEKMYMGLNQQKTYDMFVMVTDQAGNIAITDVITKPSLWISKATIGEKVNDGKEGSRQYSRAESTELTFRGQDSNNVDIMKTTYQVLGTVDKAGSIAGSIVTEGQQLSDEYTLGDKETRTIALQADGNWTVKVHNYNKEGKLVTTNTVEVTRDITAPEITNFTKTGIATTTWSVLTNAKDTTSGFATKNDTYQYFLNNSSKALQASNSYTYTELNYASKPSYTAKVVVKDKAGNTDEKSVSIAYTTRSFYYTGSANGYTIPKTGLYVLEVWGASGGNGANAEGGRGGFSRGVLSLAEGTGCVVMVGGQGSDGVTQGTATGGFNGGGPGKSSDICVGGGGGGATFIAIDGDTVLVAGGGGGGLGGYGNGHGGCGGGPAGGGGYKGDGNNVQAGNGGQSDRDGTKEQGFCYGGYGGGFHSGGNWDWFGGGGGSGYCGGAECGETMYRLTDVPERIWWNRNRTYW